MYTIEDLFDKRSIIGSKLERVFEQNGYTKAHICRETGISRPTLDKLLSGILTSKINYEKHIVKILEFLAITPDMLLGKTQNKYIQARTIRNAMHISVEEIAEPTGLSIERLKEIEAGEVATKADLRDIALVLSTSVRGLLGTSCFDTQIATLEMILKIYHKDAETVGLSGFWGHVGVLPINTAEHLWFPITGATRKMIYETMDMERMVIPCMNNKLLLLNMENIKEIVLLDEACDEPCFTNWDPSVDCGETPLVVYDALYDFDPSCGAHISTDILSSNFQALLKEYIKQRAWNDNDINAMLYDSTIYYKDGRIEKMEIDFDGMETVSSEVSRILDFGDSIATEKTLRFDTIEGAEIILNVKNISILAMPLLKVEDAICSCWEELNDD